MLKYETIDVAEGQRWRHLKRGTEYEVLGVAELQAGRPQHENAALVVYRGADGKIWARNSAEFTDGRFALSDASGAAVSAPAEKLNRDFTARRIKELMDEGDGFWRACSGCQESEDGYVSEKDYPFDPMFRCQPGGGCSECGGIGVLWDDGHGYDDITGDEEPASASAGDGVDAATRMMRDCADDLVSTASHHGQYAAIDQDKIDGLRDAVRDYDAALARPRAAVGDREALIAELLPLIQKAASPNGWEWMFPLRVKPVDGKPTIVSHKGGNLFRGYIGTWQEADMLVALANAAPRIILALQSPPAKVEG